VLLPHSQVECATLQLLLQAFPSPSTLGEVVPHQPPAGLFIYSSIRECSSPTLHPLPLLGVFFFLAACLLFCFFYSLFSPVWGSVYPVGYADLAQGCLWEYHMLFSSPGGLRLTWSGDAMCRLGVWRCWSFASSWWFFL
jgi:hypothetical protein